MHVLTPMCTKLFVGWGLAMCGVRTRPRTDVDPPRVELPSAGGAYRLAAPGG